VECVHCKESFSSKINHLSEPIDIYRCLQDPWGRPCISGSPG
jgi:transcription elongation factor Elf1